MGPNGSLLCSQEPTTIHEPDESSPHPPHFFMIHFNIILPPKSRSSQWSVPFTVPNKNYVCISLLPYACYMPCPSHYPCFDQPNTIWLRVQMILIAHCSTSSCHLIPLQYKYTLQHTVLSYYTSTNFHTYSFFLISILVPNFWHWHLVDLYKIWLLL
jgi:hypothetical protein